MSLNHRTKKSERSYELNHILLEIIKCSLNSYTIFLKFCPVFINSFMVSLKYLYNISTIFATTCTAFAPIVRLAIFYFEHSPKSNYSCQFYALISCACLDHLHFLLQSHKIHINIVLSCCQNC